MQYKCYARDASSKTIAGTATCVCKLWRNTEYVLQRSASVPAEVSVSPTASEAVSSESQHMKTPDVLSEPVEEPEELLSHTPDLFDLREAYHDLVLAPQVTHQDIISVHGKVGHVTLTVKNRGKLYAYTQCLERLDHNQKGLGSGPSHAESPLWKWAPHRSNKPQA